MHARFAFGVSAGPASLCSSQSVVLPACAASPPPLLLGLRDHINLTMSCMHPVPWSLNAYGTPSASVARAANAAGSGSYGLSVTAGNAQAIVAAGPAISLTAGASCVLSTARTRTCNVIIRAAGGFHADPAPTTCMLSGCVAHPHSSSRRNPTRSAPLLMLLSLLLMWVPPVAGARVHVYLSARAPSDDAVKLELLLLDAANLPAASSPVDAYADISVTLAATWQFFTLVRCCMGAGMLLLCVTAAFAVVEASTLAHTSADQHTAAVWPMLLSTLLVLLLLVVREASP